MKKFEYRLEQIDVDIKSVLNQEQTKTQEILNQKLNELGKEGWRLCGVNGSWYYFTREMTAFI